MNLIIISVVLFGHWLSDFILQKNKIKPTKNKKEKIKRILKHLNPHTLYYSVIMTILVTLLYFCNIFGAQYWWSSILFFFITYITHFIVDFTITLINSNYLSKNKRHLYFITIGLDQFLHYVILFWTINLIYF